MPPAVPAASAAQNPAAQNPAGPRLAAMVWVVGAAALVGLAVSAAAVAWSGAAVGPPQGILDAGPAVRWALPLVRVVHDVAASLTVGALLFAALVVPGATRRESSALEEPRRGTALQIATVAAFVWAVAGAAGVAFTFADAAGLPLSHPAFPSELVASVWPIISLRVGLISVICAFVVASGASLARARSTALGLLVVAVFGVIVLALAGHAGGSADHETAVNALGAHLLGATVWVGGLLVLVVMRPVLGPSLGVVARRYSTIALWCFVTMGVSGLMTATTRLKSWDDLTTPYGRLLLVKIAAFVALGVVGWWHRRVTIDALTQPGNASEHSPGSPRSIGARNERRTSGGGSGIRPRLWRRPTAFVRLAAGEAVVMGLAFGIATALTRTAPPVPETQPNPSRALALTGFPEPPAPTALAWLTAWRVEWLFLAVGLLAIGLYVAGVVKLVRRGDSWPVLRTVSWVLGWLVFVYATNGVLGIYGRVSFSWHMTIHMVEAMVVPIFLVLGAPVTLALRTLKARTDGTLGPRELVLGAVHSPVLRVMGNPIFAAAFFFMSLVAFYWTSLFELALTTHTGHLVMTAHFVLAGYLFAWVLVGVDPGPARWSPPMRLMVLFATVAFHAFFGVAMLSGTAVLAPNFFNAIDLPWIDPLHDQQLGGSIAWAIGELPALVLALTVAVQWSRSDKAESVRRDRRVDRDGDAELAAYNERLAKLAERDSR